MKYLAQIEAHRRAALDALNKMRASIDDAREDSDDLDDGKAWSEVLGAISGAQTIIEREDRAAVLLSDSGAEDDTTTLLQAARELVSDFADTDPYELDRAGFTKLRAAIAKAEGGAA